MKENENGDEKKKKNEKNKLEKNNSPKCKIIDVNKDKSDRNMEINLFPGFGTIKIDVVKAAGLSDLKYIPSVRKQKLFFYIT